MARGRGIGRRFVRPAPKTKIWIGAGIAEVTLVSNAEALVAVYSAAILAFRPFTILRTRLEINFRSDQVGSTEVPTGVYGEIIVKETATGIGVTALPGTITDPEADWYVYQGMTCAFEVVTAAGFMTPAGSSWTVDSKAMRKVGPTDDLAACFQMRNVGGGLLNVEGRQLIQLH